MKSVIVVFLACILSSALSETAWKLPADESKLPRIVNGVRASPKYRLGTALIIYQYEGDYYGSCTGSIVGRKWVISAAHCFQSIDGSIIGQGERKWGALPSTRWATAKDARWAGISAKKVWIHKRFKGTDFQYDIAVLELEKEIPDHRYKKVRFSAVPKDKTRVKAVGYGAINEDRTEARRCRMVDVVYRKFSFCQANEPTDNKYSQARLICAVSLGFPEGKTDTCYGDSGGPLYKIRSDDKLFQIGITSFANGACASYGNIPWYVRASAYSRAVRKLKNGKAGPFFSINGDLTRR